MKVKMTITVEESILKDFNKITKEKSINKSLFIENKIKEFINSANLTPKTKEYIEQMAKEFEIMLIRQQNI
jgi:hypothetical protein